MKTAIIADSTGDLSDEILSLPDIYQITLKTVFNDDTTFEDSNKISKIKNFYKKLKNSSTLPKTSQPEPAQTVQILKSLIKKKYQNVIFILLSSGLSGTIQTCKTIAKNYKNKINSFFVDSKGVSVVIENLVNQALRLLKEKKDLNLITKKLQWAANQSDIYILLGNLKNLVKGGRLSRSEGFLGNLLRIKPVLDINNSGKVIVLEKVRTSKRAFKHLLGYISEKYRKFKGKAIVYFAHADDEETAINLKKEFLKNHPNAQIIVRYLTPVLGTYGGNGTIGTVVIPTVH